MAQMFDRFRGFAVLALLLGMGLGPAANGQNVVPSAELKRQQDLGAAVDARAQRVPERLSFEPAMAGREHAGLRNDERERGRIGQAARLLHSTERIGIGASEGDVHRHRRPGIDSGGATLVTHGHHDGTALRVFSHQLRDALLDERIGPGQPGLQLEESMIDGPDLDDEAVAGNVGAAVAEACHGAKARHQVPVVREVKRARYQATLRRRPSSKSTAAE